MRLAFALRIAVAVASSAAIASPCSPPVDTQALLLEGVKLHEAGAYDDAIAAYRCVLDTDPSNVEARYELAYSTFAKSQYLAAIEILEPIARAPRTAPRGTWLLLGSAHALLGHWALAERTYRDGMALYPSDPQLGFYLALSLAAQGRFEIATEAFENCLRDSPYRAEVWRAFGDALYDAGSKGRAFAAYARSLTLENDTPPASEAAKKMWAMIFEGAGGPAAPAGAVGDPVRVRVAEGDARSRSSAAEAAGMSLLALLREREPWRQETDARFFVYALDTTLKLVSSLQSTKGADPFWGPFVLSYFDAMRAEDHLEALAYDIRRAAGDPEALLWRERNSAKIAAFRRSSDGWAVSRPGDDAGNAPR